MRRDAITEGRSSAFIGSRSFLPSKHVQRLEDTDGDERTENVMVCVSRQSEENPEPDDWNRARRSATKLFLFTVWGGCELTWRLALNFKNQFQRKKIDTQKKYNTKTLSGIHKNYFWWGHYLDKQTTDVATNQR